MIVMYESYMIIIIDIIDIGRGLDNLLKLFPEIWVGSCQDRLDAKFASPKRPP